MVVTSREDVAARLAALRQYGWRTPQVSEELGWNSRLDEMQAAMLRVKLRHLSRLLGVRRAIAAAYADGIVSPEITHPHTQEGVDHSFHLYVVRTEQREALAGHLRRRGVATAIHYAVPIHRQPGYAAVCVSHPMSETDRAAATVLSLPLFTALGVEVVERVIGAVNSYSTAPKAVLS